MKPRAQIFIVIGFLFLILGIAWYTFPSRNQELTQTFPATINRDCAPWDGAAFTVTIPVQESIIDISIYQSPDSKLPATFSFPDETGKVGNASLILPIGSPKQLTGKVSFQRIKEGRPVEGIFDLATDAGQHFKGMFKAEWDNKIIMCG